MIAELLADLYQQGLGENAEALQSLKTYAFSDAVSAEKQTKGSALLRAVKRRDVGYVRRFCGQNVDDRAAALVACESSEIADILITAQVPFQREILKKAHNKVRPASLLSMAAAKARHEMVEFFSQFPMPAFSSAHTVYQSSVPDAPSLLIASLRAGNTDEARTLLEQMADPFAKEHGTCAMDLSCGKLHLLTQTGFDEVLDLAKQDMSGRQPWRSLASRYSTAFRIEHSGHCWAGTIPSDPVIATPSTNETRFASIVDDIPVPLDHLELPDGEWRAPVPFIANFYVLPPRSGKWAMVVSVRPALDIVFVELPSTEGYAFAGGYFFPSKSLTDEIQPLRLRGRHPDFHVVPISSPALAPHLRHTLWHVGCALPSSVIFFPACGPGVAVISRDMCYAREFKEESAANAGDIERMWVAAAALGDKCVAVTNEGHIYCIREDFTLERWGSCEQVVTVVAEEEHNDHLDLFASVHKLLSRTANDLSAADVSTCIERCRVAGVAQSCIDSVTGMLLQRCLLSLKRIPRMSSNDNNQVAPALPDNRGDVEVQHLIDVVQALDISEVLLIHDSEIRSICEKVTHFVCIHAVEVGELHRAMVLAMQLHCTRLPAYAAVIRRLSPHVPHSWDLGQLGRTPNLLHKREVVDPLTLKLLNNLLMQTFVKRYTRDRRGGAVPKTLQLQTAIAVENVQLWENYTHKLTSIQKTMRPVTVEAPATNIAALTAFLRRQKMPSLGPEEAYLFHGTSMEATNAIAAGDFLIKMAGTHVGTLYGRGVYFAECSSKADEYAEYDKVTGYRSLLLTRVALGNMLRTCAVTPDGDALARECLEGVRSYHSVVGDRIVASKTFREFVIYDPAQVYANYILLYKRIYH
eukprot:GEMP01019209.1.p1 GENE.GEMP01019209.1~~GEMP01019209.1.p1  ORF type:complete len:865 (+),score=205.59 GEMP01019209.1:77-2671(+)